MFVFVSVSTKQNSRKNEMGFSIHVRARIKKVFKAKIVGFYVIVSFLHLKFFVLLCGKEILHFARNVREKTKSRNLISS